jgi:hypothetical protein
MAFLKADEMEAQAGLKDAKIGGSPSVADSAIITRTYPILGSVDTEGGEQKSIEHPFGATEIDALAAKGIHIAWEWSFDPASGLDEGRLYRIYIGTTADGPRLAWYDNRWRRLHSHGNYGKKYALGGTWSSDKATYGSMQEADPEIAAIINSTLKMTKMNNANKS